MTPGQVPVYQLESNYLFDRFDFRGKSVLDIGCWDGYFSFMAEQRGARRVLALDNLSFRWGGLDGFNFLYEHFQSKVEWREGTVYRLPEETFDIVLCYGVLYHLSDPLLAAINCFQRAEEFVVFESVMIENPQPALLLLEPPYQQDPSNVYAPSTGFLEKVAQLNGFKLIELKPCGNRIAMLFQVSAKTKPLYLPRCFPPT